MIRMRVPLESSPNKSAPKSPVRTIRPWTCGTSECLSQGRREASVSRSPMPLPGRRNGGARCRTEDALETLAAELNGSAHPADLADSTQVATLVQRVEDEFGPVDVLVNNAGIESTAGFADAPDDEGCAESPRSTTWLLQNLPASDPSNASPRWRAHRQRVLACGQRPTTTSRRPNPSSARIACEPRSTFPGRRWPRRSSRPYARVGAMCDSPNDPSPSP